MKMVCISINGIQRMNKNFTYEPLYISEMLTIGKTYEILSDDEYGNGARLPIQQYFIADDGTELLFYENDEDFITLEQHRKNQLNKIGI